MIDSIKEVVVDDFTAVMLILLGLARFIDFVLMPSGRKRVIQGAGDLWVLLESVQWRGILNSDATIILELIQRIKQKMIVPVLIFSVSTTLSIGLAFSFFAG